MSDEKIRACDCRCILCDHQAYAFYNGTGDTDALPDPYCHKCLCETKTEALSNTPPQFNEMGYPLH